MSEYVEERMNGPRDQEQKNLLGEGRRLEAEENISGAYLAYLRAHQKSPFTAHPLFRAGLMAQRQGNGTAAVRAFEHAVSLPDALPNYWYYYGRAVHRVGDPYRARTAFAQFIRWRSEVNRPVFRHEGGLLEFDLAVRYGVVERPEYAHSMLHAAKLAEALNLDRIRVAEFGVASGRGLLAAEKLAGIVSELTGVGIEVWGFDTGRGIPESTDVRDLRHYFGPADYTMQEENKLRERLTSANLVIGDARETVSQWVPDGPPIGALFFDMDLYSSTLGVLEVLGQSNLDDFYLPRTSLTFDDIGPKSPDFRIKDYSDITGEAAAIRDFNATYPHVQAAPDKYFTALPEHAPWHDMCYIMHRLRHVRYGDRVRASAHDHMKLR